MIFKKIMEYSNMICSDESNQLLGSSKGLSWGYIVEGPGKSIECWRRFMSLPLQDQANILQGISMGRMDYEIENH